jgi:hypothetical protein
MKSTNEILIQSKAHRIKELFENTNFSSSKALAQFRNAGGKTARYYYILNNPETKLSAAEERFFSIFFGISVNELFND